jgi:hypothetical protein
LVNSAEVNRLNPHTIVQSDSQVSGFNVKEKTKAGKDYQPEKSYENRQTRNMNAI